MNRSATIRNGIETLRKGGIPQVDAHALCYVQNPLPDERAVLTLASAFQIAEDGPNYWVVSWNNQVKATTFYNEHGLSDTLDKIRSIAPYLLEN